MNKIAIIVSLIVGGVAIILGAALGWALFPNIIHSEISKNVELKKGTDQYKRFVTLAVPFQFKVYIFNIENPDGIRNGEIPKVKQLGPYIYTESRKKSTSEIDNNTENITYTEQQTYIFDQKASGNCKEDDRIIIINPAVIGAVQDKLGIIQLKTEEQRKKVFKSPDMFLNTTVNDFLFVGNDNTLCTPNPQNVLPCKFIKSKKVRNFRLAEDGQTLIFTFFAHKNITNDGVYTVSSGETNIGDVGEILSWQNKRYLENMWDGGENSSCNQVKGRDAVLYPPFITDSQTLTVFNTDICRTIDLKYSESLTYRDVTAYRFIIPKNTLDSTNTKCYFIEKSETTVHEGRLKNGLLDLKNCYGATVVFSWPHLLYADDTYKNSVEGLNPIENDHYTYIDVEPNTGTPLRGAKRVQFNMILRADTSDIMKNVKHSVVPILWLEEGVEINEEMYKVLYDSYVANMKLVDGVRWGLIAVGIFIVVVTVTCGFRLNAEKKKYLT